MTTRSDKSDPLNTVPDPETVRVMLAEAIRLRDLLRSLLRVAVRKANYPPPQRRPASQSQVNQKGSQGVA